MRSLHDTVTPVGIGPSKKAMGSNAPKDSSVGNSSAGMSVDDVCLRLFVDMHYIITTILNAGT